MQKGAKNTGASDMRGSARLYPVSNRGKYKPPHRVRFTPELWDKWWAARKPTQNSLILREGIEKQRALLQLQWRARPHS